MPPSNEPGRSKSSPATFMQAFRGSARKKTAAFRKRLSLSGCLKIDNVERDSLHQQPASVQLSDFLAYKNEKAQGELDKNQQEWMASKHGPRADTKRRPHSEYLPALPFDTGSSTSLGNVSEMPEGSCTEFSNSQISLPSSFAAPLSVNGWDSLPRPQSTTGESDTALPARPRSQIETPECFARFCVNRENLVELDTNPVLAEPVNKPANILELPASVTSTAIAIDSTPIPVTFANASSGKSNAEQFKAYPGLPRRKPVSESYVIPALQAGYVGGVPPELKVGHARHRSNATVSSDNKEPGGHYSWPLIDFREEMFLNHKPSQAGVVTPRRRHPKHQEPRIPSMDFSEGPLEEEVIAMLARLEQEKREADQPRGCLSPISPSERRRVVHEMEASIPHASNARSGHEVANGTDGRAELCVGRTGSWPPGRQAIVSPVSPLSSDGGRVSYHEYAWPRFSEAQRYVDPAEEYSKTYRDRRREGRRERVQGQQQQQQQQQQHT